MKDTDMTQGKPLDSTALDTLYREARTYNTWQDKDVTDAQLQEIYNLLKFGPTSANCSPARLIFVKTAEAKEKLKPCLDAGNVEKTMNAPVTAIIANDMNFYEHMPKLFPHTDAKSWFVGKPDYIAETAARNGTLQGAYLILAARSVGLDCGPMSGFNKKKLKDTFFPDEDFQPNFLCNIGYGDPSGLHPRSPRFDFDEVCQIL